ncbi:MAG: hypothetical protein EBR34_15275 [Sphingomonadaceae bacterium]|nr:hypothetical protein [Sphingomonadaceae bacterium]
MTRTLAQFLSIDNATVGHRTECGTDWPINVSLSRFAPSGHKRPVWTVTTTCRGIAEDSKDYNRKADAVAAYQSLVR